MVVVPMVAMMAEMAAAVMAEVPAVMVMPEVPIVTMMKAIVLVMIAAHPTVGVEHSRVHVSIPDDWRLRRSPQALLKRKPQAARRKWS